MDISTVATKLTATISDGGSRVVDQAYPVASSSAPPISTIGTDGANQTASPERVDQAVKQVNDDFTQKGQSLRASYEKDKATGIYIVKISDTNTREVIKQYPSEKIVAIAEAIDQYIESKGRLIYAKA